MLGFMGGMPQTNEEKNAAFRAWYATRKEKQRAYQRQYRANNRARFVKYQKKKTAQRAEWRKANPEENAAIKRRQYFWQKYNLTVEQVDGILEAQGYQCATCMSDLKNRRPNVDHCHTTGKVRGILCHPCNVSLGLVCDNPTTLRAMIEYLKNSGTQNPS